LSSADDYLKTKNKQIMLSDNSCVYVEAAICGIGL